MPNKKAEAIWHIAELFIVSVKKSGLNARLLGRKNQKMYGTVRTHEFRAKRIYRQNLCNLGFDISESREQN